MTASRSRLLSRRPAAGLGLAAFAGLTGALWAASRGKWSDALIDSGREWIVPDALARGDLLYRDVVHWFGPFTPYFHAGFFRVFGSGFSTLVLAGSVATVLCLAALFVVSSRVTGRVEAALWAALALPALAFMPNAGGSILGMGYRIWHAAGFAAAAIALSARGGDRGRAAAAGACCALGALCRLEWGLAAIAATCLALVLSVRSPSERGRQVAAALAVFAAATAAGLGVFALLAGARALISDSHVLLTGLPVETRTFLVAYSGIRDWPRGIAELSYSAAMWLGVVLLVEVIALWPGDRGLARRRLRLLPIVFVVLAASALAGGASSAIVFSAAPLVCLAALVAGLRGTAGTSSPALAACGLLGVVLSYRRPFHIADAAYVGPPLLFAFVSAAGLLAGRAAAVPHPTGRKRVRAAFAGLVAFAVVGTFVVRTVDYLDRDGESIEGTGGWLTARPELARELAALSRAIRSGTAENGTLVMFPEGEVVNFTARRRNPLRHKLYIPGYLSDANEPQVLAELARERPSAVVIWRRPTSEYGRSLFGVDYGRSLRAWVEAHYELRPLRAAGAPARANPRFVYGFRR